MLVTRRYRFAASHRLHQKALPDEDNRRIYGKCNNPFGHGHNYVLDVSVEGGRDPKTGRVVDPRVLDGLVWTEVLAPLDRKNLNAQAPEFADGETPPTSERLAEVIANRLRRAWEMKFPENGPQLRKVLLEETSNNKFELVLPLRHRKGLGDAGEAWAPNHVEGIEAHE